MRKIVTLATAAGVSALALGAVAPQPAKAADMYMPQAQYGAPPLPPQNYAPPQGYYPPPQEGYAYPPPPPATVVQEGYAYPPPPPPAAYYPYPERVYFGLARSYYAGPYWRGYGPRFAYGYGHWSHGYRRW